MGFTFDQIPEREPLAPDGWGPGISEDLREIKARDLVNEEFAVMGFIVLPSSYNHTPFDDPDQKPEYAKVEIMMPNNDRFYFNTSSASLMTALKKRWRNNQTEDNPTGDIPFRTRLVETQSKSSKYKYYAFE